MGVLQKLSRLLIALFVLFGVAGVSLGQDFEAVDTFDRYILFAWSVDVGTNVFTLYVSSSVVLTTTTYSFAEYMIEITTEAVSKTTYFYEFSFPFEWNGRYPYINIYAVLTVETSWYFWVSPVLEVPLQVEVIYQDVDSDGNYEIARNLDGNIGNGYESYRDFELNSQVYRRVDWDNDGVFEFLIDTTLNSRPDILWVPHTQEIFKLLRRNVDRDGAAEYEIVGTNMFFDPSENKFSKFCLLKGSVKSDKGEVLSLARLSLSYEDEEPFLRWETDDEGKFEVYITTLTVEKHCVVEVKLNGYLTQTRRLWLEHDKEYVVDFVLYPVVVKKDEFLAFPNPVKKGDILRIVINSSRGQKVKVLLLDSEGSFIAKFLDGELSAGQHEFYFFMKYPPGFYYLVGNIGDKKVRQLLRVVKE